MHGSFFVESLKKYTIETLVNNNKAMLKDIESGTKFYYTYTQCCH